jgi:hypothetical protein
MSTKKKTEQIHKLLSETYRPIWYGQFPYCIYIDADTSEATLRLSKSTFIKQALELVGDNKSADAVAKWFDEETGKLSKKLIAYLDTLEDNGEGSDTMCTDMLIRFSDEDNISDDTVVIFFESFYKEKFLPNYIKKLLDGLDPKTTDIEVLKEYKLRIFKEHTEGIAKFCMDNLYDWYSKNILDDKLIDLFSQFVLTLGKTDWKVTWVGHGPVTKEKILNHFRDEDDFHNEYIMKRYDEWYEAEVSEAGEREMNNAYHTRLWDGIQSGRLKLNTDEIDEQINRENLDE